MQAHNHGISAKWALFSGLFREGEFFCFEIVPISTARSAPIVDLIVRGYIESFPGKEL